MIFDYWDLVIFYYFVVKNSKDSGNLESAILLYNLKNDVICGYSLVGSNPRGPPVFQALSPYQTSSHYLFRFSSSGSDTIEKLKFWSNFLKFPLIFHRSDPWNFLFLAGNLNFDATCLEKPRITMMENEWKLSGKCCSSWDPTFTSVL